MVQTKNERPKNKMIFSLRVKQILKDKGIEPILETDNLHKPGFKCWIYECTEEFEQALSAISEGRA